MTKPRFETPDLSAANIEKIAALFPSAITETLDEEKSTPENKVYKKAVNFEALKTLLGDDNLSGNEAYEFTWVGKKASVIEANRPIRKTLRPCKEESRDWDTTQNIYIEGDNLEVLKLLQENYLGKVKMIYIDPPYNTGNDFVYRDKFQVTSSEWAEDIGQIDEETGDKLFRNTESNGRFHSDWCSMIYPRLLLARNLLQDDGVIFISIDDNEVENLKKICDEVFGENNFISQIIVQTNPRGRTFDKFIAKTHEYVFVYTNNSNAESLYLIPKDENAIAGYQKEDEKGKYRLLELRNRNPVFNRQNRPLMYFPFYANSKTMKVSLTKNKDFSVEIFPRNSQGEDGCWTWGFEKAKREIALLVANLASTGKWTVFRKDYLEGTSLYTKSKAIWLEKEINHENGKEEVGSLFGKTPFDFPKSVEYIKKCLLLGTKKNSFDIVLDFFAGSATTAHAVMQLNAEDGGKRKFIMVQLPEPCDKDSEAAKAGYKNICEIGKERIRRAGNKIREEAGLNGQNLDIGFRVFKVADSNMKDVYYGAGEYKQEDLDLFVSNIKEDRTALDLLYGCLLDWGLTLDMPHTEEIIDGFAVHIVRDESEGVVLAACFEEGISEKAITAIAKKKPLRAVFRDSGFASDPAKINVFELFKLHAPDTQVRVI
jgi:adenine-specific DNA-methyltransferase